MTDERDPQNNGVNDNHRPGMPDRGNPRPPSGRFPAITPGRANINQGRFSQTGMQAVARGNAPAAPAAPAPAAPATPAPAPGRAPTVNAARGQRPGAMPPRPSVRPPIHSGADAAAPAAPAAPAIHGAPAGRAPNHGMPAIRAAHVPASEMPKADVAPEIVQPLVETAAEPEAPIAEPSAPDIDMPLPSEPQPASVSEDAPAVEEAHGETQAPEALDETPAQPEPVEEPAAQPEALDEAPAQPEPVEEHTAAPEPVAENHEDIEAQHEPEPAIEPELEKAEEDAETPEPVIDEQPETPEPVIDEQPETAKDKDEIDEAVSIDDIPPSEHAEPLLLTAPPVQAPAVIPEPEPEPEPEYEDEDSLPEDAPAEKGPAFVIKPIPPELRNEASLRDNAAYRRESRSLLRTQSWNELVQMMQNVLQYAPWADLPEVRSSILKEMAGIYGDKLDNKEKERETFAQLLREDPSNESALTYMDNALRATGDFRAIHDMYSKVVDAIWESEDRLLYTQKAVDIAEQELSDSKLVIRDWEHLWNLGEHSDEVQSSLMAAYREHACWQKLAEFIRTKCADWGHIQRLGLREVIEIYISGLSDAERASETLKVLLKDRPNDPLLLLQEISVCRLNGDVDKLAKLSRMPGLDKKVELDIHRAAAEVLWNKGEYELAVEAYDAILLELPNDRDALHAKEQYFLQGDLNDQLCNFYKERAEAALSADNTAAAIDNYRKAADVAETRLFDNEVAISLLKKLVELDNSDVDTHKKIISLYEALDDDQGVATSMEALLALTSRPAARRELLSKLGTLYLDKLENYERAEDCWKKVQAIDPRDPDVSEELSRVYAKQGDFESLDSSLTQQIRVADPENVLPLAESKGKYLMQHSPASAHTAAAWEIVLDCDPDNRNALENLSEVLEKLHRESEMIGAWEQALRTIEDRDERISLAMRIADASVDCAPHAQAVSAYLRVLCWDPTNETALSALESLCNESERGIVIAALEIAATLTDDTDKRCNVLKQTLRFIPKTNVVQRIQLMRRILQLGDHSIENDFVSLCRSQNHSKDLCAAWTRRAFEADTVEERDRLLSDIARIHTEDFSDYTLAFTILFASALDDQKAVALAEELEKLAPQTNRWEEVVAVLGCLTSAQFAPEIRRSAIQKRIDILLTRLDDPARALEEYQRLLAMDPANAELLENIERLALEKGLSEQLLGIYGEIWDATEDKSLRAEIADKCFNIQKNVLAHGYEALTELFIGYRLMPSAELEAKLIAETDIPENAPLCVTMLESAKRAFSADSTSLTAVADIYETKLGSIAGAFALHASVLTAEPSNLDSLEKLAAWSDDPRLAGRYAQTLRLAASRAHASGEIDTSLSLYRKLADFYKGPLNDLERSVDVERTILHIEPSCIESLESLIAWHEAREEWAQLRSEIQQRISAGGCTPEQKIALWLRVVDISNNHLSDLESAFDGYAEILQIDETNEDARNGLAALTDADIGPEVELRRLKLELKLSSEDKRPEILLQIAGLQRDQLSQPDAACETLEKLYKETGACGIGYAPLKDAYTALKLWPNLVQIMLERADSIVDDDELEASDIYNAALEIVDEKLHDAALSARIVEKLQKLEPDNDEIIDRYCASLRAAGDWNKYADTIRELAGNPNSKSVNKTHLFELARIQALALDQTDAAIETYRNINKTGTPEKNAYFGLASMALKKGDIDLYLNALESVLKLVDPVWGAIFYCHMAEVCDEKDRTAQVGTFYRNARILDANNVEASDSLRSLGRRLKNWRSTSALLPLENERELSWSDRSKKLVELSCKADSNDAARIWAWKAIAVDHDNVEAWQRLASIEEKCNNLKEAYEASLGAFGAVERTTLPTPDQAPKIAKLMFDVAQVAQACGNDAKSETLLRRAYAIAPSFAPVAMAIGDFEQDCGNLDKAYGIYDTILKTNNALDKETKSEVLFKRGLLSNNRKDYAHALDDLRETIKIAPLHYDALMAIAKSYAKLNQPLLALASLQQSLLVTPDQTKRRGNTYYDMGKIWSDCFNDADEAGIYYEGALNNGASNVDLVERSLEVYKRAGRYQEALELVDTLTKTTVDPAVLASLWCTRGELSESISTESATEAYDMALSYQPGLSRAFDGLERMLVATQEWKQLAELLDGRLESDLPKDQENAILVRLADLYSKQLNEPKKASSILYRLLETAPSAEIIEKLLAMPQDDEEKTRMLMEKAITYCSGCYNYALKLAQSHLQAGRELQAWAIMSPLRALLQLDAQTKETLNDLKNKFEKTESISLDSIAKALPVLSDEQFAILDALQAVSLKLGPLGPTSLEQVTTGATEVTEFTPNGKIFHQMRAGLGLENIALWRSSELPEAIVIVSADPLIVCIRTEIFQKAAGNELQFWLAKGLGLAHPDVRILASAPAEIRDILPKAVLAAADVIPVTQETQALVSKIKAALTEEDLKNLSAQISVYDADKLRECAETFTRDMLLSSDILASYIVADMRTVWRAETRIDDRITEQRNVKTIDEISKAFEVSYVLRSVLAYYVSSTFSEHIA